MPAEQSEVRYTNVLSSARGLASQILPNGSGVAAGDVDGDGWVDIYFGGLDSNNRLYRNLGHWRFEDITAAAGVACPGLDATGTAFADLEGDGDLDLIVNSIGGGTRLFFNDGKAHFSEAKEVLNPGRGGTSMALADVDGDGDLDLYIANYRAATYSDAPPPRFTVTTVNGQFTVTLVDGRPLTDPDLTNRFNFRFILEGGGRGRLTHEENGEPDLLLINDSKGRFRTVPFTDGTFLDRDGRRLAAPPLDWGLAVAFRDLNADQWPDLYVCNDFGSPDRLWLSDGQGHLRAAPPLALRQTCLNSMSVDFADLNRDGHDEILVVDMLSPDHQRRLTQRNMMRAELAPAGDPYARPQYVRNTLQLSRGDGTYAEIAQYSGLEASDWSWAPLFIDVDLDGYEDLLVGNGFERDNMNLDALAAIDRQRTGPRTARPPISQLRRMFPRLATPNLAFRNLGNLKFRDTSQAWGFSDPTISQGLCLADLDNDGDLDVVVNNLNDAAALYRNEGGAPRVGVRLKGRAPNTRGIGAKVKLLGGAVPAQSQEMMSGGRFQSADDAMRVFAAGTLTNRLRIEVHWRSGRHSVLEEVQANRCYEIDEAWARPRESVAPPPPVPWFEDVSSQLGIRHVDEPFDDFARQPLLPKRMSQLGPGVAWFDLDGDGWDDLVVASGKGGQLTAMRNDGRGGFRRLTGAPYDRVVTRDQTTVLGWHNPSGQRSLLVGLANYEDGLSQGASLHQYDLSSGQIMEGAAGHPSSPGPVALADVDGDGLLDLFLGGRMVPRRYPEAASSRLFRNRDGKFTLDTEASRVLEKVGMVSGAVFSDLTGDGYPELVLACEWGPIRIFENERGRFRDVTAEWGLGEYSGWWNSIAVGDFDSDGLLDLAGGNWGSNTRYESHRAQPLRLYYGDLDQDGSVDLLEAYYEVTLQKVVPENRLDTMLKGLPFLAERFQRHQDYALASIDTVLGERSARASLLTANWLESTVFLNRGRRFEARALPLEAQLSPAFAVCVADLDGDGAEDLFLSQNFFDVDLDTSRYDAGLGLWLRGDGRGGFAAVTPQESGIRVPGEQRGAALGDYDQDGRVDLVVAQNSAEIKLYRNRKGRPGLRVRLAGPAGNPEGVGSVIRLRRAGRLGPARELHAGSGYWSQESRVLVMAAEGADAVIVRWPDGQTTSTPIAPGTRECTVAR